jgi:uncharacterized protein (DUF1684 family)
MKQLLFFIVLISYSLNAQNTEAIKEIETHQEEQNTQFKTKGKSPLTEVARKHFKELDFFEIDLKYRVDAKFTRTPNEEVFAAGTSSGRTKFLIKYGLLTFSINGIDLTLAVYQSQQLLTNPIYKDYLFLPFNDLSNGDTTYSGGRFIDLTIPKGDTIIVDFNQAYNPYCAYSDGWNCTIPPIENTLEIEIPVGVKKFKDH